MSSQTPSYRGYRFPPEIISHAVGGLRSIFDEPNKSLLHPEGCLEGHQGVFRDVQGFLDEAHLDEGSGSFSTSFVTLTGSVGRAVGVKAATSAPSVR